MKAPRIQWYGESIKVKDIPNLIKCHMIHLLKEQGLQNVPPEIGISEYAIRFTDRSKMKLRQVLDYVYDQLASFKDPPDIVAQVTEEVESFYNLTKIIGKDM